MIQERRRNVGNIRYKILEINYPVSMIVFNKRLVEVEPIGWGQGENKVRLVPCDEAQKLIVVEPNSNNLFAKKVDIPGTQLSIIVAGTHDVHNIPQYSLYVKRIGKYSGETYCYEIPITNYLHVFPQP